MRKINGRIACADNTWLVSYMCGVVINLLSWLEPPMRKSSLMALISKMPCLSICFFLFGTSTYTTCVMTIPVAILVHQRCNFYHLTRARCWSTQMIVWCARAHRLELCVLYVNPISTDLFVTLSHKAHDIYRGSCFVITVITYNLHIMYICAYMRIYKTAPFWSRTHILNISITNGII